MKTVFAAILLLAAPPALAHAFLKSASPPVGASVPAPADIVLTFTEGVEPDFSTIIVQNAAGGRVDRNNVHRAGGDTKLAIGVVRLAPGTYAVTWHATSVDTHKTQGHFAFTVTP